MRYLITFLFLVSLIPPAGAGAIYPAEPDPSVCPGSIRIGDRQIIHLWFEELQVKYAKYLRQDTEFRARAKEIEATLKGCGYTPECREGVEAIFRAKAETSVQLWFRYTAEYKEIRARLLRACPGLALPPAPTEAPIKIAI